MADVAGAAQPDGELGSVGRLTPALVARAASLVRVTYRTLSMTITHLDALGHMVTDGHAYPGRPLADLLGPEGPRAGSVHAFRDGVVGRGVLLDVAVIAPLRIPGATGSPANPICVF